MQFSFYTSPGLFIQTSTICLKFRDRFEGPGDSREQCLRSTCPTQPIPRSAQTACARGARGMLLTYHPVVPMQPHLPTRGTCAELVLLRRLLDLHEADRAGRQVSGQERFKLGTAGFNWSCGTTGVRAARSCMRKIELGISQVGIIMKFMVFQIY